MIRGDEFGWEDVTSLTSKDCIDYVEETIGMDNASEKVINAIKYNLNYFYYEFAEEYDVIPLDDFLNEKYEDEIADYRDEELEEQKKELAEMNGWCDSEECL